MPDASSPAPDPINVQYDLLTQLVAGPSIREVAAATLRPALTALYPQLQIDPSLAAVVAPSWLLTKDHVAPGPRHFESLTGALVRHAVGATPVLYLEGEHYLTLQPQDQVPAQLPVSIEAIGHLLNELAPLLFVAFQEQQLDYWNQITRAATPRWKGLSTSLRERWNVPANPDWDNDRSAMARLLFSHPDKTVRAAHDRYDCRACLIDLDAVSAGVSTHLNLLDMAVLIGTVDKRTVITTHTIVQGFQAFDSFEALGESLRTYSREQKPGVTVNWRLIEPQGNFFDHLACNLIALQSDGIGSLADPPSAPVADLAPHIRRTSQDFSPTAKDAPSRLDRVQAALPDWMANASSTDLTAYSRHLMDLAVVQGQHKGLAFNDGIKPIRAYAEEQLRVALLEDHPDATDLDLADIHVDIESVVAWGSFLPPVPTEHTRLNLIDLALQNLIALPTGNKSVSSGASSTLPEWLTVSYLETLVTRMDIGKTYPALIKTRLLDDPLDSLRRQNLFTARLRIELPLLALQQKIRQHNGVDELGYRYVAAVVQVLAANRRVEGEEIVIRPLAFKPGWRTGASADEVTNMFVIGPRQMDKGPCLLYRPLLDQPLSQYPTPANLIYAIRHAPELRKSVLAWLPDNVRPNYANYVFPGNLPSVWSVSQLLADPLTTLQMSGTLSLGSRVIEGDYLAGFYQANANALIDLAQRQSLSNAQSRWETFKQAAWLILNAALPFMGKTVGTAAWIWQVLDDVQQTIDGHAEDSSARQESAITDLLLNLAVVLAHHAATRRPPAARRTEKPLIKITTQDPPAAKEVPGEVTVAVVRLPDVTGAASATSHSASLATDVVLDLVRTLERFRITPPDDLMPPPRDGGPYQHLHCSQNRFYTKVGERWFEVAVNEDADVSIIDSREQPARQGPGLIGNSSGDWYIDTRLRLRGGGMSSRRKALKQQNRQRIADLKTQLADFDRTLENANSELTQAYTTMKQASDKALPALQQQFLQKLEQRTGEYAVPMEQLKTLNQLETVPTYRTSMTKMLGAQLFLNQSWLDQKKHEFGQALMQTLTLLEAEETSTNAEGRATYQKMIDLNEGLIGKIEFAHACFLDLSRLGRGASEIAATYKARLPAYSLNDLKALQVSLTREVCLKEGTSAALTSARNDLTRILDTTTLAIQTSQELMLENGVWVAEERIEALNGVLEQFAATDRILEDFAIAHQKVVLEQPFALMCTRISEFHQQTERFFAQLLLEQPTQTPRSVPAKATTASRKRVVKTRFRGTVVGEIRTAAPGEPVLLDVRAPLTGQVIATFHEKTPGVWLERVAAQPHRSVTKPASAETLIAQGQTLLDELDNFIAQTDTSARKPGRLPVEIEELFQQKAEQFDHAARALEKLPTPANTTQSPARSNTALIARLNAARDRLYAEGQRLRVEMIKRQPPTATRVEWLHSKNEIDIVANGSRRRLKGPRKDYLQEYEIRERSSGQTLWYAHFHYAAADSPASAFTAAHLKLRDQRLLGAFDRRAATSDPQVITIYRSEISPTLARTLFFSRA
ncbi:hypothetical protein ACXR0M_01040 [Pseudomonas sp. Eth.TT006]